MSNKVRSRWAHEALPELNRFALRTQRAAGLRSGVDVLLVSGDEMRAMNRKFGGHDKVTDVLSFSASSDESGGDIAICAARAEEQACDFGHGPENEAKILILHGMLHLAGYDHESDGGEMARKEQRLRKQLGLPHGLIERSGARRRR